MSILHPDFSALLEKANSPVGKALHNQSIQAAEEIVQRALPEGPTAYHDCPQRVDGCYTQEYLENLQRFDDRSWFFQNAFTLLSYAYCTTGEARYLEKFSRCVESCFLNPRFGPPNAEFDHCSSRICRSLSIAASWLEDSLDPSLKTAIQRRLMEEVDGFILKYSRAGEDYPIGPNDHQGKDLSGAGTASIYLMGFYPQYRQACQRFLYLFKDKFIPQTATLEGGWIDGYDLLFYELMDDSLYKAAVKDELGLDIAADPRLAAAAGHVFSCLPVQLSFRQPYFAYSHGLFYMASAYQRRELQYLAEKFTLEGESDPRFAPYSLYFYDVGLPSQPLLTDAHIAQDFGLMRLGQSFSEDKVYVFLRSGPTEAFCRNNQNGVLLSAYGKQLLGNVWMPGVGYQTLWDTVYTQGLWTSRCANVLLINGQNQERNRYGEDWAPITAFHRPNRKKWGDEDAWWFDFEAPREPYGRALCAVEKDGFSVMSGAAHRAYGKSVSLYTRHVVKFKDDLILIIDCLRLTEAANVAFRACTDYDMELEDQSVVIHADGAHARIAFSDCPALEVARWSFQPQFGYYLTAEYPLEAGDHVLACAIRPCRESVMEPLSVEIDPMEHSYVIRAGEHSLALPEATYESGEDIRGV